MAQKTSLIGENHAQNVAKSTKISIEGNDFKTAFRYNIDLLKHVCVVSKIENSGWMKFFKFLHPGVQK